MIEIDSETRLNVFLVRAGKFRMTQKNNLPKMRADARIFSIFYFLLPILRRNADFFAGFFLGKFSQEIKFGSPDFFRSG